MSRREIVLVADDDPGIRSMLGAALGRAGYRWEAVPHGRAALDRARTLAPSLIALDAMMPGMTGFEVCQELKRQPETAHVPVIFLTGLGETEHVLHGLRAGGVDYLAKPVVIDEFIARIERHIASARAARNARAALDMAGRPLFAIDRNRVLLWRTPQAAEMLAAIGFDDDEGLPLAVAKSLAKVIDSGSEFGGRDLKISADTFRVEITYLGFGNEEFCFQIRKASSGLDVQRLQSALKLTTREAEILRWIAGGKSSKDIACIADISPRTVNKHVQRIYDKIGVENRATAAAVATRILMDQGCASADLDMMATSRFFRCRSR